MEDTREMHYSPSVYLIEIFKKIRRNFPWNSCQHSPPLCTPSRGYLVASRRDALCAPWRTFPWKLGIRLDDRNRISGSDSENDALHARPSYLERGNSVSGNPPRFVSPRKIFWERVSNTLVYEQQLTFVDIRPRSCRCNIESNRIEDGFFEKISLNDSRWLRRKQTQHSCNTLGCMGKEKLAFEISIVEKRRGYLRGVNWILEAVRGPFKLVNGLPLNRNLFKNLVTRGLSSEGVSISSRRFAGEGGQRGRINEIELTMEEGGRYI